jgi:hypothetical protein
LKFAPYNFAYPHLDEHIKAVGFDVSMTNSIFSNFIFILLDVNKWELIFDFTKDENGEKKNFEHLDPSEFEFVEKRVDGEEVDPIRAIPYPKRFGGT